ncbi:MAG: hypothetical protein KatS3mg104_1813 [Phycisphaerae bacterium]|jgi:hypothetical protein|nr:MAG: hypothetical protein KatS3mg104_1813 [Phycisphaerae bacterium]
MALQLTLPPNAIRDRLSEIGDEIAVTAKQHAVSDFDLRLRAGLHLPLLWHEENWADRLAERELLDELANEIEDKQLFYRTAFRPVHPPAGGVRELSLFRLSADDVATTARAIFENFHYLNSFRPDAQYFALGVSKSHPCSFFSLSAFDLPHLLPAIGAAADTTVAPGRILVLSRAYAFRWAPHNWASHGISELLRMVREQYPQVEALVTYLNPNLGFTGRSYVASNWGLIATEKLSTISYLNRRYITARRVSSLDRRERAKVVDVHLEQLPLRLYAFGWGRLAALRCFAGRPCEVEAATFDPRG